MSAIAFVIDARPGQGRINGRAKMQARGGKRRIGKSDAYRGFVGAVARAAEAQRGKVETFRSGVLAVAITIYCETQRHLDRLPAGYELGELDVDAPIKAILDGLQAGRLVDDDVRIAEVHVRKRLDRKRPRVAVRIWHLLEDDC